MSIIHQNLLRLSCHSAQKRLQRLAFYEYTTLLITKQDTTKQLCNSLKRTCGMSLFEHGYKSGNNTGFFFEKNKAEEALIDSRPVTSSHIAYHQQELFLTQQLEFFLPKADQLTNQVWKETQTAVLGKPGRINEKNIDAITISKCSDLQSLSLGKSYFKFLRSERTKLNRAVYGNYLRLFYDCSNECNEEDCQEVINIYEELVQTFPVLDSYTTEKALLALSITKRWTEYSKLFKTIEMFYNPTSQVYCAVVKAAFKNKNFNLGWELLEEAQYRRIVVHDDVYLFWIYEVSDESVNMDEKLTKVMNFLKQFDIKPSVNLTEVIKESFEKSDPQRMGTFTAVSRRGECNVCHAKLEPTWVSQEDFDELRSAFLNPVLIGKDIFLKTQPEEMKHFLSFLSRQGPFDVVLDGLNIALRVHDDNKNPAMFTHLLKSVVKHFLNSGEKVLVLGRKHMTKWPTNEMKFIYDNAGVFLAENFSQDDPFLLYAALHSGLGTRFVSQDLMRGHKFLLTNPKLQGTFQRWQAQHQYFLAYVEHNGTVHLKEPIKFMQSIQQNSRGDWHIPYTVKEILNSKDKVDNFHRHWLCLVKKASLVTRNANYQNFTRSSRKPPSTYLERKKEIKLLQQVQNPEYLDAHESLYMKKHFPNLVNNEPGYLQNSPFLK